MCHLQNSRLALSCFRVLLEKMLFLWYVLYLRVPQHFLSLACWYGFLISSDSNNCSASWNVCWTIAMDLVLVFVLEQSSPKVQADSCYKLQKSSAWKVQQKRASLNNSDVRHDILGTYSVAGQRQHRAQLVPTVLCRPRVCAVDLFVMETSL